MDLLHVATYQKHTTIQNGVSNLTRLATRVEGEGNTLPSDVTDQTTTEYFTPLFEGFKPQNISDNFSPSAIHSNVTKLEQLEYFTRNALDGNKSQTVSVTFKQKESCQPVKSIAFIKTHKTGSSTLANILQRFGLTYHLNFALPRKKLYNGPFNYINKPGMPFNADILIPLPTNESYNVLWSHSVYNKAEFRNVLPPDTVYISILRDPFQQFVSSVAYYHILDPINKFNASFLLGSNPISTFLSTPVYKRILNLRGNFGYQCNKQAQDLGFGEPEFKNISLRQSYIKSLDQDFTLMMIMEHFDESLLILKKKLCWSMKDILYIPKNVNTNKPPYNFTSRDHANHRKYSQVDYSLYDHFTKVYNEYIQIQSEDFFKELAHFRNVLELVKEKCFTTTAFTMEKTKWHDSFTVGTEDCDMMTMSELQGLVKIRSTIIHYYKLQD